MDRLKKLRWMAIGCGFFTAIINGALMINHIRRGNYSLLPAYLPWVLLGIVIIYAKGDMVSLWRGNKDENEYPDYMADKIPEDFSRNMTTTSVETDSPKFAEIELNPNGKETTSNPLCPVCEKPIVPVSTDFERRFICGCEDVRNFTFEEEYESVLMDIGNVE